MLLLIVLALVAAITFFHYVQGFFSATLSAILCIIAAVVAFGFHESLARMIGGKLPEYAHAIVLVVLFAAIYAILRVIFDSQIPGNLQMPLLVDKVGAALMGLVASVFAVGIAVIAAQTLPFGPSVGGYARYAVADTASVPVANKKGEEAPMPSALQNDKFNSTLSSAIFNDVPASGLVIPVDDVVVNTVGKLSAGGAFSAERPLSAVHPDYLGELFFQRLGIQPGARHVAVNTDESKQINFRAPLYSPVSALMVRDAEPARSTKLALPKNLQSSASDLLVIARLSVDGDAADSDGNSRISPATVRMVVNGKNYIPIGTLDQLSFQVPTVLVNRPDDFIVSPAGAPIDFVFQIPTTELLPDVDLRKPPIQVKGDTFLEAKRMGFVQLQGVEIKREVPPPADKSAFRKYPPRPVAKVIAVPSDTAAAASTDSPFEAVQPPKESSAFVTTINVGAIANDSAPFTLADVKGTLRARKFATLEVTPARALDALKQGDVQITELATPDGKKVVQFTATTRDGDHRWDFAAKLAATELADAAGATYKVNGAWGKVKTADGEERLTAAYNADAPIAEIPRYENGPTEVGLIFVVPSGTKLAELRVDGKRVASADLTVP